MKLQLGRAVGIVRQTLPYIGYRAIVYGIICGAVALGLGILVLIGKVFGGGAAGVLLIIALAAGGFGFRFLREYVLYLLQAGHIALITEIVDNGKLPSGITQTAWAKERVMHFFKEVSVLALIDQLVKGIVNAVNRSLFNIMNALPIPSMEGLAKVVQRLVYFSLTYVDEAVIAYTFKTKSENVFDSAKSGVIVYCQGWKSILKNAVALTLLSYVFVIGATIVFLIPLGLIAASLPETAGFAKFVLFLLALFLGISAKWILFDPVACTSTVLTFLAEAEANPPSPEWEARIESVSDRFRTLKDKAAEKWRDMQDKDKPEGTAAPVPATEPAADAGEPATADAEARPPTTDAEERQAG